MRAPALFGSRGGQAPNGHWSTIVTLCRISILTPNNKAGSFGTRTAVWVRLLSTVELQNASHLDLKNYQTTAPIEAGKILPEV